MLSDSRESLPVNSEPVPYDHHFNDAIARDRTCEIQTSQSSLTINNKLVDMGSQTAAENDRANDHDRTFGSEDLSLFFCSRTSPDESFSELINWPDSPSETDGTNIHQQELDDEDRSKEAVPSTASEGNSERKRKPFGENGTADHVSKKQRQSKATPLPGYRESLLREHILRERIRHQSSHITYEQPVWPLLAQGPNSSWHKKYQLPLETFFFALGSSEAVSLLQDMLACQRKESTSISLSGLDLSKIQRLQVIENLDERISYFGFLKRCHTYQLVLDCCGPDRLTLDGFIPQTTTVAGKGDRASKGNPLNIADSQLTVSMMEDLWPDLRKEHSMYKKKYNLATGLRQLGQRLAYMVDCFGFGILGLIPNSSGVACSDAVLSIDDRM